MARSRLPLWVRTFNPIAKVLLAVGVPMGPEVLITVRGRKSGLPRSTPVAVAQVGGRWWLVGPFGEGDWIRNLRAAGRATLTSGRRKEQITAMELGQAEKLEFFRGILDPYISSRPVVGWIVRNIDRIPRDPAEAAERVFVFEVHRASGDAGSASGRPR